MLACEAPNEEDEELTPGSDFSSRKFLKYIENAVQSLFGCKNVNLSQNESNFETSIQFCNSETLRVLYIIKDQSMNADNNVSESNYLLKTEPEASEGICVGTIVKTCIHLRNDVNIGDQIHILTIPKYNDDSISILLPILHSITPLFKISSRNSEYVQSIRSRISELKLMLEIISNNPEVRNAEFKRHPILDLAISRSAERNEEPSLVCLEEGLINTQVIDEVEAHMDCFLSFIKRIIDVINNSPVRSTKHEVIFWEYAKNIMHKIHVELEQDHTKLSLKLLNSDRRFRYYISLCSDTEFKSTKRKVEAYCKFVKDLEIEKVFTSSSIDDIEMVVENIFTQIKNKWISSAYPVSRMRVFCEHLSADLSLQIAFILSEYHLLEMSHRGFKNIVGRFENLLYYIDSSFSYVKTLANELYKKENSPYLFMNLSSDHVKIKKRLNTIKLFREDHQKFITAIDKICKKSAPGPRDDMFFDRADKVDKLLLASVENAYNKMNMINAVDVSDKGYETWLTCKEEYDKIIYHAESAIISHISNVLEKEENDNDVFNILSRFTDLLTRPRIASLVHEYQSRLLKNIEARIELISGRMKSQFQSLNINSMYELCNISETTSFILHARQIKLKLKECIHKSKIILGDDLSKHPRGEEISRHVSFLCRNLDEDQIIKSWADRSLNTLQKITGSILRVRQDDNRLVLEANIDWKRIEMLKEISQITLNGCIIPHAVLVFSETFENIYPFILSFSECIRNYMYNMDILENNSNAKFLVDDLNSKIKQEILKLTKITWDNVSDMGCSPSVNEESKISISSLKKFIFLISEFDKRTWTVIDIDKSIGLSINEIAVCDFKKDLFESFIRDIQNKLDKASFLECKNISIYVTSINKKINTIMEARFKEEISAFLNRVMGNQDTSYRYFHKLSFSSGELKIESLEYAKKEIFKRMDDFIASVINIPILKPYHYESSSSVNDGRLGFISSCEEHISNFVSSVENIFNKANGLRLYWLDYEYLLNNDLVQGFLFKCSKNLDLCIKVLKATIDSHEQLMITPEISRFGPFTIDATEVKGLIFEKHKIFKRRLESEHNLILFREIKDLNEYILVLKIKLDESGVNMLNVKSTVNLLCEVESIKYTIPKIKDRLALIKKSYEFIEGNGYMSSKVKEYAEAPELAYKSLLRCLEIEERIIENKKEIICSKIDIETESALVDINSLENKRKMLYSLCNGRDLFTKTSLNDLSTIEKSLNDKLSEIESNVDIINRCRLFMGIDVKKNPKLLEVKQSITYISNILNPIRTPLGMINNLRKTPISGTNSHSIIGELERIVDSMSVIPLKKNFVYANLDREVGYYMDQAKYITRMSIDSMKERHIKQIIDRLNSELEIQVKDICFGDFLDLNIAENWKKVEEIVRSSKEEHIIEAFLQKQDSIWSESKISFSKHSTSDSKVKELIVTNLEELSFTLSESLSALIKLESSPHFSYFSERVFNLEAKLSSAVSLFEIWSTVQSQWLYLKGILSENNEIKQILPHEAGSFELINREYNEIVKENLKFLFKLDISVTESCINRLKDMDNSLNQIKRSLMTYMQEERNEIARFYLVGNEDLLEIIGGGIKSLLEQNYINKMFPGILSLIVDDQLGQIKGAESKEGEIFIFLNPINFRELQNIKSLIKLLDNEIQYSLSTLVRQLYMESNKNLIGNTEYFIELVKEYPNQILLLVYRIIFTERLESSISSDSLRDLYKFACDILESLVLLSKESISSVLRRKYQNVFFETTRQKNILDTLTNNKVETINCYNWLSQLRFYYNDGKPVIKILTYSFEYTYEYQGVPESLVHTSLTQDCFMALCASVSNKFGGSPFGPSGTGKTETVKSLGMFLGRLVVVFCCDERFDFESVGLLLTGICRLGAWGCFDEFNRLEERILSAVSQQIRDIQEGLKLDRQITLVKNKISVNVNTGIFITMNPNYLGRSSIPVNLKSLFRKISVTSPNYLEVAYITLKSKNFKDSDNLSLKIVEIIESCKAQFLSVSCYNLSLRLLKSILSHSGEMKDKNLNEEERIVRSLNDILLPQLRSTDKDIYSCAMKFIFRDTKSSYFETEIINSLVQEYLEKKKIQVSKGWMDKVQQLNSLLNLKDGIILTGPPGSGKTLSYESLIYAYENMHKVKGNIYILSPKILGKSEMFGELAHNTREWTDGIFTRILRKANNTKQPGFHWIIFDGDVDPNWVENLNSLLDENKCLTLQSGERISLKEGVKVILETDSLKDTTLATISRCGLVRFSEDDMRIESFARSFSSKLRLLSKFQEALSLFLSEDSFIIHKALDMARNVELLGQLHPIRSLESFFILLQKAINEANSSGVSWDILEFFIKKKALLSLIWSFSAAMNSCERLKFTRSILSIPSLSKVDKTNYKELNLTKYDIMNYNVDVKSGEFARYEEQNTISYKSKYPRIVVTPTILSYSAAMVPLIENGCMIILHGLPGSGKSTLLQFTLCNIPSADVVEVSFTKHTSANNILDILEANCVYKSFGTGAVLSPLKSKLFIICNRIDSVEPDKYGTYIPLLFIMHLVKYKRFWHWKRRCWVELKSISFIATSNSPCKAHILPKRFTHLANTFVLEIPNRDTLIFIYSYMWKNVFQYLDHVTKYHEAISLASIEFYLALNTKFQNKYFYTQDMIFRWISGVKAIVNDKIYLTINDFVLIWANEALRIFQDSISDESDRNWIKTNLANIIERNLENIIPGRTLSVIKGCLLLYNSEYANYDVNTARDCMKNLFNTYEDQYNVRVIPFDEYLDTVIKVTHAICRSGGNVLLIGPPASGKNLAIGAILKMNKFTFYEFTPHKNHNTGDFENILDSVFESAVCKNEKTLFAIRGDFTYIHILNDIISDSTASPIFRKHIKGNSSLNQEERIRNNLRIVILSNVEPIFYHKFYTVCVREWSNESLKSVSDNILGDTASNFSEVFVYLHNIIVSKLQNKYNITFRHFLDFLDCFMSVHASKLRELKENEGRLSVGLFKMNKALETISELKKDLSDKKAALEAKNVQAKEKLKIMVENQQQAESKKQISIDTHLEYEKKKLQIEDRKALLLKELADIEPQVRDAKTRVKDIKKQQLAEVRTMTNPPKAVKVTMESVCTLLGNQIESWKDVQIILKRDDFIPKIINYQIETMSKRTCNELANIIEENSEIDRDLVNRASKACGPLYDWIIAQLKYSVILNRVNPMKVELEVLKNELTGIFKKADEVSNLIDMLENNIKNYSDEYSALLKESRDLNVEMIQVEKKVNRNEKLLESLASEIERWKKKLEGKESDLVLGSSILSSAYISYFGILEQAQRSRLYYESINCLKRFNIEHSINLSVASYLSTLNERINWRSEFSFDDEFYIENIIIINRSSRYIFIVDPSGVATTILEKIEKKKIAVTSFLDKNILSTLEDSLTFGVPLLIQNAESYDPALNGLIKRNFIQTSDGTFINIKGKLVRVSSGFRLFLSTRESVTKASETIFGHMNVVNFQITNEDVQIQCFRTILESRKRGIEEQRRISVRLQGEYEVRLRALEDLFLNILSDSTTSIIDDDIVLTTLESLKQESNVIKTESAKADSLINEINDLSHVYQDLTNECCNIFLILRALKGINAFYDFSLKFFLKIISWTLLNCDQHLRNDEILYEIYKSVFIWISRGLFEDDKLILGILILCSLAGPNSLDYFLSNTKETIPAKFTEQMKSLESSSKMRILAKYSISKLSTAASDSEEFFALATSTLEKSFNYDFNSSLSSILRESYQDVIGLNIVTMLSTEEHEDPGKDVETVAREMSKDLTSISLGSNEACRLAESSIKSSSLKGGWVLLKGADFSPEWIFLNLENLIQSEKLHKDFRVFVIFQAGKIPTSEYYSEGSIIPKDSILIADKPKVGIKASLRECMLKARNLIVKNSNRELWVYFLFSWVHSVIRSRLAYAPLGWSKDYDITTTDFDMGIKVIRSWLDKSEQNANSDILESIKFTLFDVVYKAIFESERDIELLKVILDQYFKVNDFSEVILSEETENEKKLTITPYETFDEYMFWIDSLPPQNLGWLRLPLDSEKVRIRMKAYDVVSKLRRISDHIRESRYALDGHEGQPAGKSKDDRNVTIEKIVRILDGIGTGEQTIIQEQLFEKSPLSLYFQSELSLAQDILTIARKDISYLKELSCLENKSEEDANSKILSFIAKGIVPPSWELPIKLDLNQWERVISKIIAKPKTGSNISQIYIPELLNPHAFITALKQQECDRMNIPLKHARIVLETERSQDTALEILGLDLECALLENGIVHSTRKISRRSHILFLRIEDASKNLSDHKIVIPVYREESRADLIFNSYMRFSGRIEDKNNLFLNAAALVACKL